MAHVRQATIDDIAFVPALLCECFRDDPVLSWLIPETNRRHNAVVHYFRAVVQHLYLPQQQVYLTEDGSGVAVCMPAGVSGGSLPILVEIGLAWQFYRASGFRGVLRANALQATMRANRPAEPHFYLHALGVRRDQQGLGIGSSLLRHVTAFCDRLRIPAYLENSNERNLSLYERHGFRAPWESRVPGGGPPIWFMTRQPRPVATN
jgi:GNAT superfamily N-acetyltransferase